MTDALKVTTREIDIHIELAAEHPAEEMVRLLVKMIKRELPWVRYRVTAKATAANEDAIDSPPWEEKTW